MMLNVRKLFENSVGMEVGSARFVIINVSPKEVLTKNPPPYDTLNAKIAANALMI